MRINTDIAPSFTHPCASLGLHPDAREPNPSKLGVVTKVNIHDASVLLDAKGIGFSQLLQQGTKLPDLRTVFRRYVER